MPPSQTSNTSGGAPVTFVAPGGETVVASVPSSIGQDNLSGAPVQTSLTLTPALPLDTTTILNQGAVAGGAPPQAPGEQPTPPGPPLVTPGLQLAAPPFHLDLNVVDQTTGQTLTLTPQSASQSVSLTLPTFVAPLDPLTGQPVGESVYLIQVTDDAGNVLGFQRIQGAFDPVTGVTSFSLPAGQLDRNPVIIPAVITPTPVSLTPETEAFSGPGGDATSFGPVGDTSNWDVISPPVNGLVQVRDPLTGTTVWVTAPTA